jgi:pimeloyl-ACP methyl ester carboxylesterase
MTFDDRFFETGEIRLHYLEGPQNGPPLVLVHGATGSCNGWWPVRDQLAKDWHVFLLDQRGHGLSGRAASAADYHASRNIADMLAFLTGAVAEPAVVWGHSWGAVVTLLSAEATRSWLRGIVLEDPPVNIRRSLDPQMQGFMDYFGMVLKIKETAGSYDELVSALRPMNPGMPDAALAGWATDLYHTDANFLRIVLAGPEIAAGIDFAWAAREVSVPALLLRADPNMGAALLEEDLEFLLDCNPDFQLVNFPGAGHGIHADQTEKTLQVFADFAKKLNK